MITDILPVTVFLFRDGKHVSSIIKHLLVKNVLYKFESDKI